MRKTAERVEAQMEHTWPVAERLLVAVSSGPGAERLVRAARRLAERLRVEWLAVYVETPKLVRLPQAARDRILQTLRLAAELGAESANLSGESVAATLIDFARQRNVSRIIVGKPLRPRWRDRFDVSLVDELIRHARSKGKVWFATHDEVARYAREHAA